MEGQKRGDGKSAAREANPRSPARTGAAGRREKARNGFGLLELVEPRRIELQQQGQGPNPLLGKTAVQTERKRSDSNLPDTGLTSTPPSKVVQADEKSYVVGQVSERTGISNVSSRGSVTDRSWPSPEISAADLIAEYLSFSSTRRIQM